MQLVPERLSQFCSMQIRIGLCTLDVLNLSPLNRIIIYRLHSSGAQLFSCVYTLEYELVRHAPVPVAASGSAGYYSCTTVVLSVSYAPMRTWHRTFPVLEYASVHGRVPVYVHTHFKTEIYRHAVY